MLRRLVFPVPTRSQGLPVNIYCTRDDDVAELWRLDHKPNRRFPVVGAKDCPGFERADVAEATDATD